MSRVLNYFFVAGANFTCLLVLVCGNTEAKSLSPDTGLSQYEYQLVRCFGNIISSYFDTERSLLLSVPKVCYDQYKTTNSVTTSRIYCKVTDFLFASVHSYHNYPVMVIGPAFNGTFKNIVDSEKAGGFNVILGNGDDDDDVFSVFKSELARISHLPVWNTRGKFVVMSLSWNVSTVSFNPEENKLTRSVLGELWEKEVVNAIVLARNIDTNKSTGAVDVHAWFPFTEDHCRGPVNTTVILDQWGMNNDSQFLTNAELFPDKISNLYGCAVTASTFPHEPFILPNTKTDSNVTHYPEGVEISILKMVANDLNFTVKYLPEPDRESFKLFSTYDEVSGRKSDVGFASAPHTSHAIDKRDHSIGYIRETIKWFGPVAKPSPRWKGLIIIFTPLMWLLVLIVYLIASLMFWLLAKYNTSVNEHVSYKNAVMCYLQTFSIILGEAVFVRPYTWYLRLFFIVWVFYCLLINTAYQSCLISVLTHPRFLPAVDTVEKLLKSDMKYGYVSPVKFWYSGADDRASRTVMKKGMECPSLGVCLKRIVSTQDFAVCGGGLHLLYLSHKKTYRTHGEPQFVPFKDEVGSFLATMFFRPGSPFLESFNRVIYRVVESGMVQKFWEDIKLKHVGMAEEGEDGNEDEDDDDGGSDAIVLTTDHLQGAFILLLLGLSFGVIVFITELACFVIRQHIFYKLFNPPVHELKTRSFVNYKRHVIHRTFISRVRRRNLIGKSNRWY